MPTIAAVYTAQTLVEPISQLFAEILPGSRLINLVDDKMIHDVIQAGRVTTAIARRLLHIYFAAEETGADVIFTTCSSIGDAARAARTFLHVPSVKIDDAMAAEAVRMGERIGVIATLPTTLEPTKRLVQAEADAAGRRITIIDGLAKGAFEALVGKRPDEHDAMVADVAEQVARRADVLVLAQGSMARMETALAERTGKPVLASPRRGVLAVKAMLDGRPQ